MSIEREDQEPGDMSRAIARRVELRGVLAEIPELLSEDPENWVFSFAMNIYRVKRNLGAFAEETQEYLSPILDKAIGMLKEEQAYTKKHLDDPQFEPLRNIPKVEDDQAAKDEWHKKYLEMRGIRADERIMEISRYMAEPFGQEMIHINKIVVPFEEIQEKNPDDFAVREEVVEGIKMKIVSYRHPFTNVWYDRRVPFDNTIMGKGGDARLLNGIWAGAPLSMRAAELPFNDMDVVASGDQVTARAKATLLGADPAGVEMKKGELDYCDYANSRDMTINMAAIGYDGLYTCKQALEAARTGVTEISGNYRPDKAIYNTDRFSWRDPETGLREILAKQRGISREVKGVAEGKMIGYWYKDLNANTPLGIYSLWLVKRWTKYIEKPDLPSEKFGDLLQNMFELTRKMGHVPQGVDNVMDYLDLVHQDYPYFDIHKEMKDIIDEVRWKGKRLMKQADREYSWATGVPSDFAFVRRPGDTVERVISLDGFSADPEVSKQIVDWYPGFVERCKDRTKKYESLGLNPVQRYFFDLDTEESPTTDDL